MEKIFDSLQFIAACLPLACTFLFGAIETIRLISKRKPANLIENQYSEMFSSDVQNNQQDWFEFELIQEKTDLLKRNTGSSLNAEYPCIEYVEYCDSVSYH